MDLGQLSQRFAPQRIAITSGGVNGLMVAAQALVWLPLKDLETFDAFLRNMEEKVDLPMLMKIAQPWPGDLPC